MGNLASDFGFEASTSPDPNSPNAKRRAPQLGDRVQYYSDTHGAWVDCLVSVVDPDGGLEVSCKRGHRMTPLEWQFKVRPAGMAVRDAAEALSGAHLAMAPNKYERIGGAKSSTDLCEDIVVGTGPGAAVPGGLVQYWSNTHQRWVPGKILGVRPNGEVQIDIKPGHWMSLQEQDSRLRLSQISREIDPTSLVSHCLAKALPSFCLPNGRPESLPELLSDYSGSPVFRGGERLKVEDREPSPRQPSNDWGSWLGGSEVGRLHMEQHPQPPGDSAMASVMASAGSFASLSGLLGAAAGGMQQPLREEDLRLLQQQQHQQQQQHRPLPPTALDPSSSWASANSNPNSHPNSHSNSRSNSSVPPPFGESFPLASSVSSMLSSTAAFASLSPSVGSSLPSSLEERPSVGQRGGIGFDPGVEVITFKNSCPPGRLKENAKTFEGSVDRRVEVPQSWSFDSVSSLGSSVIFSSPTLPREPAPGKPKLQSVCEEVGDLPGAVSAYGGWFGR